MTDNRPASDKMRFMRKPIFSILLPALAIAVAGCRNQGDNVQGEQARALYERSVRIIVKYTDSLAQAHDSATILRMDKNYDEELTKLNYDYPSDTDLAISEGENDTLANLTLKYVSLRDSLLYRLAHPLVLRNDSLPSDTAINRQQD